MTSQDHPTTTSDHPEPAREASLADLIDLVLPVLPPYEFNLYCLMLWLSLRSDDGSVLIGKRSIAKALGKGTRSSGGNYQHITEKLSNLADWGFIDIGDADRSGTRYKVRAPRAVPAIAEKLRSEEPGTAERLDYYNDSELRASLFERDGWRCRYCGEVVTEKTATLDHIEPISAGGSNDAANLATSCMMCNSIKSGRTYEEAAPAILDRVAARRRS